MSTMRPQQVQLEFGFVKGMLPITVKPWDRQLTFVHYLASQCFKNAARNAKTALGRIEEEERISRAVTFVLDSNPSSV